MHDLNNFQAIHWIKDSEHNPHTMLALLGSSEAYEEILHTINNLPVLIAAQNDENEIILGHHINPTDHSITLKGKEICAIAAGLLSPDNATKWIERVEPEAATDASAMPPATSISSEGYNPYNYSSKEDKVTIRTGKRQLVGSLI